MDQLLRKVLIPESWDSHEGSKIQETVANDEDNSRHRDATGTPNAMDRSRRRRRHRAPVGNQQHRTLHRHSDRPYVLNEGARTEEGTLTSANPRRYSNYAKLHRCIPGGRPGPGLLTEQATPSTNFSKEKGPTLNPIKRGNILRPRNAPTARTITTSHPRGSPTSTGPQP